jgi:hypothetical protein
VVDDPGEEADGVLFLEQLEACLGEGVHVPRSLSCYI